MQIDQSTTRFTIVYPVAFKSFHAYIQIQPANTRITFAIARSSTQVLVENVNYNGIPKANFGWLNIGY